MAKTDMPSPSPSPNMHLSANQRSRYGKRKLAYVRHISRIMIGRSKNKHFKPEN
jgi:hypothetical protein